MWFIASLAAAAAALQPPRIPFEPGVTLTYAAAITGKPDWESRVTVVSHDGNVAVLQSTWSAVSKEGAVRWFNAERLMPDEDRRSARSFHVYVATKDPRNYSGSTFHMPSRTVYLELKRSGKAHVEFLAPEIFALPYKGELKRTGSEAVKTNVNGRQATLPGLRAEGTFYNANSPQPETIFSFVFLDDSITPWILVVEARNTAGRGRRQLVSIRYGARASNVETDLARNCRATEYGILFASGSAELDSASRPALVAIAKALNDHPAWPLRIVGHTDSIGTRPANLELSVRRAEQVRLTLIRDHAIAATRLRAAGRGEDMPIDDNGTLGGRARNRRVELLRDCS